MKKFVYGPITSIRLQDSRIVDGSRYSTIAIKWMHGSTHHYRINDLAQVSHESYVAYAKIQAKSFFDYFVDGRVHDVETGGDFDSLWSVEESR